MPSIQLSLESSVKIMMMMMIMMMAKNKMQEIGSLPIPILR
jgi:hypothetical protein